jgi:NADH:ubiquinone oxidoreductase subunit 6 (subunit J)
MATSDIFVNGLFYLFALIAIAGAVGVAASRNIVRSAFALLAVLFAAAALYALMKSDFIAAAQVLIYVGGILVLIIFAVMLTHRITDVRISNDSTPGPAAFCAVLCLLFALVVIILPVPDAAHNKWDRVRGSEMQKVEGSDYTLLQFQADGKTGLAHGGATFEDEVVVGLKADTWPADALRVNVEAIEFKPEMEKEKAEEKPKEAAREPEKSETPKPEPVKVVKSEPIIKDRPMVLVRLSNLKDTKFTWKIQVVGDKESPWMSPKGDPDFVVQKGVTEPIAWALANRYLFAFEAISVLLLAALVGAAFLARKEVRE